MMRIWAMIVLHAEESGSRCQAIRGFFFATALLGLLFLPLVLPATAQSTVIAWSTPEIVVQTDGEASVSSMALVADDIGHLHGFYAHRPEENIAVGIDYVWWNGETWSSPVNIIVNRDGSGVMNVRAAIDVNQGLHLIWEGGGNTLYYASVPVVDAASARAWSEPVRLVTAIGEPDIIVSSDNVIYVTYVDPDSSMVAVIMSEDGGQTWSTPSSVASSNSGTIPREVRMTVDTAGRQHVAWTEVQLPDGWPPTGAFYAQSVDGGVSWSQPLRIAEPYHGQIGVAAVGEDQVHLVWRSTIGGDGTFHQWSADGGNTWSTPNCHPDRGGFSGLPSFAVDSMNRLHYVIGPAFATSWQNGVLGPYVDVAGSELRTGVNQSPGWTYPELAVMAITAGNRLHVIFETGFHELWHTTMLSDASVSSLPTPTPTATPLPTPTSSPSYSDHGAFSDNGAVAIIDDTAPVSTASALLPFIGTGVVVLLVLGLVAIKAQRHV